MSIQAIPTLMENLRIEGSWRLNRFDMKYPARMLVLGHKEYAADYHLDAKRYDVFQVQIVLHGKLGLRTSKHDVELNPGTGIVFRLGSDFEVWSQDSSADVLYFSFRADSRAAFKGTTTWFEVDSAMRSLIGTLQSEIARDQEANRWLQHSLCEGIAARAHELAPCPTWTGQKSNVMDVAIAHACVILESIDHTEQSPCDLLSSLGVSYRHLVRRFKQRVGLSPKQYQIQARIQVACRLLVDTDLTISEIAWKLMYSSPQNFSRQFQSVRGQTPAEYRREHIADRD